MRLIIVRHAAVTFGPEQPSKEWHLSPEGRAATDALSRQPLWETIDLLHTSSEPKAIGTAQRIAAPNSMRVCVERDLREVERPWVGGEPYRDVATRYLRGEAISGWEPRSEARNRMRASLERASPGGDLAIVSHGLALTLLLAELLALGDDEAVTMWSQLMFPDTAILDWPSGRLEREFGG